MKIQMKGYKLVKIFPRPSVIFAKKYFKNRKGLMGAEIGVYQGENANWILSTLDFKRFYLIDPYSNYEGYKDAKIHYGKDQDSLEIAKKEAHNLLRFRENITWIEEKSVIGLGQIEKQLDFIYIDANHQYEYVKQDIYNSWKKLKNGGILAGDDIDNGYDKEHDGVMKAVLELIEKENLKLHIAQGDWWVIKGDKYQKYYQY